MPKISLFLHALFLFFFSLTIIAIEPSEKTKPIDVEINRLTNELSKLRITLENEEVQAQNLMQVEWKDYAEKMKEVEKTQNAIQVLNERIEKLEQQKKEFMKNNSL